jgi:hypothetical protein
VRGTSAEAEQRRANERSGLSEWSGSWFGGGFVQLRRSRKMNAADVVASEARRH